jgi:hypothetical protein
MRKRRTRAILAERTSECNSFLMFFFPISKKDFARLWRAIAQGRLDLRV